MNTLKVNTHEKTKQSDVEPCALTEYNLETLVAEATVAIEIAETMVVEAAMETEIKIEEVKSLVEEAAMKIEIKIAAIKTMVAEATIAAKVDTVEGVRKRDQPMEVPITDQIRNQGHNMVPEIVTAQIIIPTLLIHRHAIVTRKERPRAIEPNMRNGVKDKAIAA